MAVSPPEEPEFVIEEEDGEEVAESDDEKDETRVEEDLAEGEDDAADGDEAPKAGSRNRIHDSARLPCVRLLLGMICILLDCRIMQLWMWIQRLL